MAESGSNILDIFITTILSFLPYFLSIITFCAGIFVDRYFQKTSHKREKAKEIDQKIIGKLKESAEEYRGYLDKRTIVGLDNPTPEATLVFNENHFLNFLKDTDIYSVNSGELELTYTQDRVLNKHSKTLLQILKNYRSLVLALKSDINKLNNFPIPESFKSDIESLTTQQYGPVLITQVREKELIFIIFASAVCESPGSYTGSARQVVALVKERFNELQEIIQKYPDAFELSEQIKKNTKQISIAIDNLLSEIEALHVEWLNKSII